MKTKAVVRLVRPTCPKDCRRNLAQVCEALSNLTGYSCERAWVEAVIMCLVQPYVLRDFQLHKKWDESYHSLVAAVDKWAETLPRHSE